MVARAIHNILLTKATRPVQYWNYHFHMSFTTGYLLLFWLFALSAKGALHDSYPYYALTTNPNCEGGLGFGALWGYDPLTRSSPTELFNFTYHV
jgi:hypothetical protein